MPQRRIPKSLRRLCEWKIILNLPVYSAEELQTLPTQLCEELICLYDFYYNDNDQNLLWKSSFTYRNGLIKADMKNFKLPFLDDCNLFNGTLMMVLETCKNLTHCSCNFHKQSQLNLHQLVTSMPNLIELILNIGKPLEKYADLPYSHDDIFEAIGNTCCHLEVLHLTDSRITTRGVRRFCQSNSVCAKIKELNLSSSHVTVKGCLAVLRNLKQLRRFYCHGLVPQAFLKLFEHLNESVTPSFQLCELEKIFSTDLIPTGFFSFVMACCPNMEFLHLQVENKFNRHIEDLKRCHENIWLQLDVCDVVNYTAHLDFVGCRVTELSLSWCDVHLPTIGFSCPNLAVLNLWGVHYMPFDCMAENYSGVTYSKLLELNVKPLGKLSISIDMLQFLLQYCFELQTLSIASNNNFTDEAIFKILVEVNPLRQLTRFELFQCNAVSVIAILRLLQLDNELRWLTVNYCEKIRDNERFQIEELIKENNVCVTLEVTEDVPDVESDDESGEESDNESDDESGEKSDNDSDDC